MLSCPSALATTTRGLGGSASPSPAAFIPPTVLDAVKSSAYMGDKKRRHAK